MSKKQEQEQKISMYDPSVDAYREMPVSKAEKLVDSAKKAEKELKNLNK